MSFQQIEPPQGIDEERALNISGRSTRLQVHPPQGGVGESNVIIIESPYEAINDWFSLDFEKRIKFTVNEGQVPSRQTNFPQLISGVFPELIGLTQNQILFVGLDNKRLPKEIEKFDSSTGELIAWTKDVYIEDESGVFMYYKNPSTNEPDSKDVWDENYKTVLHFNTLPSGPSSIIDSTINGNNGTPVNTVNQANGHIGFGNEFSSGFANLQSTEWPIGNSERTISFWVSVDINASNEIIETGNGVIGERLDIGISNVTGIKVDLNGGIASTGIALTVGFHKITIRVPVGATNLLDIIVMDNGVVIPTSLLSGTNVPIDTNALGVIFEANQKIMDELQISIVDRGIDYEVTQYNNQNDPSLFYTVGDPVSRDIVNSRIKHSDSTYDISDNVNLDSSVLIPDSGDSIDLLWSGDGTKLYVLDDFVGNRAIHQHSVSIPFDITSTIILEGSFSLIPEIESPVGMSWNDDGTKLYVVDSITNTIYQYEITSPYNLLPIALDGDVSITSQDSSPTDIVWNNDGTKMYIIGTSSDSIHQYSVLTPFVVTSTVTLDGSFSVTSQETSPTAMAWNSNGTKVYIVGIDSDSIHQYSVSTPFDVTSVVTFNGSFDVSSEDPNPRGLAWNSNGTKVYVLGFSSDNVYQYSVSVSFDITSTVTLDGSFSIVLQSTNGRGLMWSNNGSRMYVSDNATDSIHQYSVSTPFDVTSTVTFDGSFDVSSEDGNPRGMSWNNDGTKLYFMGFSSRRVYQYSISTPFDMTQTVTQRGVLDVTAEEIEPFDISWSSDGERMFVLGGSKSEVHQYTLSTPFDIDPIFGSGPIFEKSFNILPQVTIATGMVWNDDGSSFFVISSQSGEIYQYNTPIRFDIFSSVTFGTSFSVASEESTPKGLTWNDNGKFLYIIGSSDTVFRYRLTNTGLVLVEE